MPRLAITFLKSYKSLGDVKCVPGTSSALLPRSPCSIVPGTPCGRRTVVAEVEVRLRGHEVMCLVIGTPYELDARPRAGYKSAPCLVIATPAGPGHRSVRSPSITSPSNT